jgi:hypothetical protein
MPMVRSHTSTSAGQPVIGNFAGRRPQAEGMAAVGVQVHFHRHVGFLQRGVVDQRLLHAIHFVVFRLGEKRRRRVGGGRDVFIQRAVIARQMPGIDRDGKVRPAAFPVGRIQRRIHVVLESRAGLCHQITARRKSEHAHLVRIDMPLGGVQAYQPQRSLRIFQRRHGRGQIVRTTIALPDVRHTWHAILQQYAGDATRRQPVAHLAAFEVDRQNLKAAARNHHDRRSGVLALRRVHRHRGARDIGDGVVGFVGSHAYELRPGNGLQVGRGSRPYRYLCVSGRRLPNRRGGVDVCAQDQ